MRQGLQQSRIVDLVFVLVIWFAHAIELPITGNGVELHGLAIENLHNLWDTKTEPRLIEEQMTRE